MCEVLGLGKWVIVLLCIEIKSYMDSLCTLEVSITIYGFCIACAIKYEMWSVYIEYTATYLHLLYNYNEVFAAPKLFIVGNINASSFDCVFKLLDERNNQNSKLSDFSTNYTNNTRRIIERLCGCSKQLIYMAIITNYN